MSTSIEIHEKGVPSLNTAAEEFERRTSEAGLDVSTLDIVIATRTADEPVASIVAERAPEWSQPAVYAHAERRDSHLVVAHEGRLYLIGKGGLGAIMAVHWVVDQLILGRDLSQVDEKRVPRFPLRTVGHDELYLKAPEGYSMRRHISWAVEHGFTSFDIRWWMLEPDHADELVEMNDLMEAYDLDGLMQGKLLQIFGDLPPEAVGHARLNSGTEITTMCVRSEYGKKAIADWVKRAAHEIPRLKMMTWYFYDVSFICQDNCPRCASTPIVKRILEFAELVDRAMGEVTDDVLTVIRTWHFMPEERNRLAEVIPEHLGAESKLASAGDEAYLPIPEYDPVYGPTERNLMRGLGERFVVEVPINDCESVDSMLGQALPELTLRRLEDVASWGSPNIRNWWASSYWVYTPNYEVAAKAFFVPTAEPSRLIEEVAIRDFGQRIAPEIVLLWKRWEQLITSWPFRSWMQRIEIFTDRTYGSLERAAIRPIRPEPFSRMLAHDRLLRPSSRDFRRLVPREMESRGNFKEHPLDWISPVMLDRYRAIFSGIDELEPLLKSIEAKALEAGNTVVDRVASQQRSLMTFRALLHTQYSFYAALYLTDQKNSVASREEKCEYDREFEQVARAEVANVERLIALFESEPNPHMAHFAPFDNNWRHGEKPLVPEQIAMLQEKRRLTSEWIDSFAPHRDSGIPYAPYVSIDKHFYQWGEDELYAATLVEQTRVLPWYALEEARWIFPRAEKLYVSHKG